MSVDAENGAVVVDHNGEFWPLNQVERLRLACQTTPSSIPHPAQPGQRLLGRSEAVVAGRDPDVHQAAGESLLGMGGTDRLIDPIHQQRRVGSRQYLRHQHPVAVLPHPILRAQHSPQPAYEPPALFGQLSLGDQRAHGLVDQAQHDLQIAGGGVGENEFQLLFHRRLAAGALMGNRSRDVVQSPNSWEQPRRQTRPLGQCAGVLGGWCRRYCHDNRWIPWLTTGDRQRV